MNKRIALALLALLATALIGLRACGGERGTEVGVTGELAGTWTSTAAGYTDRRIEIRDQEIVFGQGAEGIATHRILRVLRTPGPGDSSTYVVRYQIEAGGESEGKIELLVGSAELKIASQPGIRWTVKR